MRKGGRVSRTHPERSRHARTRLCLLSFFLGKDFLPLTPRSRSRWIQMSYLLAPSRLSTLASALVPLPLFAPRTSPGPVLAGLYSSLVSSGAVQAPVPSDPRAQTQLRRPFPVSAGAWPATPPVRAGPGLPAFVSARSPGVSGTRATRTGVSGSARGTAGAAGAEREGRVVACRARLLRCRLRRLRLRR